SLVPLYLIFLSHVPRPHRTLHLRPTRRSSDLGRNEAATPQPATEHSWNEDSVLALDIPLDAARTFAARYGQLALLWIDEQATPRSEEHTSELQSREKLVCRLLLEKKKRMRSKT